MSRTVTKFVPDLERMVENYVPETKEPITPILLGLAVAWVSAYVLVMLANETVRTVGMEVPTFVGPKAPVPYWFVASVQITHVIFCLSASCVARVYIVFVVIRTNFRYRWLMATVLLWLSVLYPRAAIFVPLRFPVVLTDWDTMLVRWCLLFPLLFHKPALFLFYLLCLFLLIAIPFLWLLCLHASGSLARASSC